MDEWEEKLIVMERLLRDIVGAEEEYIRNIIDEVYADYREYLENDEDDLDFFYETVDTFLIRELVGKENLEYLRVLRWNRAHPTSVLNLLRRAIQGGRKYRVLFSDDFDWEAARYRYLKCMGRICKMLRRRLKIQNEA